MRRLVACALVLGASLLALLPSGVGAAASSWRITRSPATMTQLVPTTVTITFSNLGGPDGNDDLGCVWIDIPASFVVVLATVTDEPSGTDWSASLTGNTSVVIRASNGGDRLDADSPDNSVTTQILVTASAKGQFDWPAHAHVDQHCDEDYSDSEDLGFTVHGILAPVPTPTPTPTPTPKPTATPTPTPRATAAPTATPTPTPAATPTPTPTPGSVAPPSSAGPATASATPAPTGPVSTSPSPAASATAAAVAIIGTASPRPPNGPVALAVVQPGAGIAMPGVDGQGPGGPPILLEQEILLPFDDDFQWVVPGLVLTFPGLLIVLVVALQAVGALAWVPVVRRRLGGTGAGVGPSVRRAPGLSPGRRSRGA